MLVVPQQRLDRHLLISLQILTFITFQIWLMGNILPLHLAEQCSEQFILFLLM